MTFKLSLCRVALRIVSNLSYKTTYNNFGLTLYALNCFPYFFLVKEVPNEDVHRVTRRSLPRIEQSQLFLEAPIILNFKHNLAIHNSYWLVIFKKITFLRLCTRLIIFWKKKTTFLVPFYIRHFLTIFYRVCTKRSRPSLFSI